jgi:hypothetical protein
LSSEFSFNLIQLYFCFFDSLLLKCHSTPDSLTKPSFPFSDPSPRAHNRFFWKIQMQRKRSFVF